MRPLSRRDPLPSTLLALTAVSGLIDAVSFVGLGRIFTANMTGNVLILGFAAAGAPGLSATASLTSLVSFVVGAVAAGRFHAALPNRRRRLLVSLGAEAVLLSAAMAVAATPGGHGRAWSHATIALMALAMGMRNATVRGLAVADMTTTVVTMTLTGLVSESSLAGGGNPRAVRRIAVVCAMALGGCAGTLLLLHYGVAGALLGTAVCVVATGVGYAAHPGSRRPEAKRAPGA